MKLSRNEQNVRRNLKFTETPVSAKRCAKATINNENDNLRKENFHLSTKKSFLLPPNTIKELHIKDRFKRNRSDMSQFRILAVNSENINPRISETSESCSPLVKNTNAHSNSVVHVKKNNTSIIQNVSLQTFNVNEQSGINILHSPDSDLANNAVEKIPENLNSNEISDVNIYESQNNDCNVRTNRLCLLSADDTDVKIDADLHSDNDLDQNNICFAERHSATTRMLSDAEKVKEASFTENGEREKCLSTTMNVCEEDLRPSLQTVKMISESCLQRSINEDERVTLSKTELTVLASKLKHLVCRLEEDVSDLKLTLTIVTKLLSAKNVQKEVKDKNETKITQQMTEITENLSGNMKVMDNMNTKLPCHQITIINMKHDDASKETRKMLDINRFKFVEINGKDNPEIQLSDQMYIASESNKKNEEVLNSPIVRQCKKLKCETRRRSARLMAKVLKNSSAVNDSFVNLENELDIVNGKSNTPITPLINQTPAKNKYQDKKIEERPMKEYMALKSRMSCLLTPNIKRFNPSEPKNNIHCETDDAKISVSDRLLAELYNLYEDSL